MAKTGELRIAQKFAGLQPQAYEFVRRLILRLAATVEWIATYREDSPVVGRN